MPTGRLDSIAQVTRAPLLAVTFVFVLLGVAAADARPSAFELIVVLLASLGFHVAVYVVNDIVDLEIDRTEPRRASSPLVRGAVSTRQMTVLAVVSGTTGVLIISLISLRAGGALGVATIALVAYDVWGKRCPIPPATDLVQGVGWAALVAAGSLAVGEVTSTTGWLAAYVVVAILLVNGVHGAVRDLANDQRHGASTTARAFGAHVAADGRFVVPTRLIAYGLALHLADVALLVVPLATSGARRSAATVTALAIVVVGGLACLLVLWRGLLRAGDRRFSMNAGLVYILVMLLLPGVLVIDRLDGVLLATIIVVFVAPWAGSSFVRSLLGPRSRQVTDVAAP